MKRKLLFCKTALLAITCLASVAVASADTMATGEWAWNVTDGTPAVVGQTTNDHLFARNTYEYVVRDNVVSFESGSTQLMWLWLDDDQIYETDWVQALTPGFLNSSGEQYDEITYSSLMFKLYLPQSIKMVSIETEDGDVIDYETGPRMPVGGLVLTWGKSNDTKLIDGVTYDIYTVVQTNTNSYGYHFSARNATQYKRNGALKKNDGALLGLYLENTLQDEDQGRLADIIIANQEFGIRETIYLDTNHQRFIYGEGGNNESQRFQWYNRVKLFGSLGFTDADLNDEDGLQGDVNGDGEITILDVVAVIDYLLGEPADNFNALNADYNLDGEISIKDVVAIIDHLMLMK